MSDFQELRPNRNSFVNYKIAKEFIILLFVFVSVYFFLNNITPISFLYFFIPFVLLEAFSFYSIIVRYNKERYLFYKDKIVRKSGSIFSDKETELVVRNITHVTLTLPFFENKLFKTGYVSVEAAGSGAIEIYMSSLDLPEKVYEYVEKLMKHNGFKLSKSEIMQQETPSSLGVFFESINYIFGMFLFSILYLAAFLIEDPSIFNSFSEYRGIFILTISVILCISFVLQYLDLKKRVYTLYSDAITYNEGFLTKNYSFMPVENLSDSFVTQTLVDKIFGLYNVKISCQGSSQEVVFKNMYNGELMEKNIDELISKSKSLLIKDSRNTYKENLIEKRSFMEDKQPKRILTDDIFVMDLKMDKKRTILPFIATLPIALLLTFFIFLPNLIIVVWSLLFLSIILKMIFTKYLIKASSMEEAYNFLSSRKKEFSNDKITGIVFKESFIDKWFNTCSIDFWSIGSGENITFKNIKKTERLYDNILKKLGIVPQDIIYPMNSQFSFSEMLKANIFVTVSAIILLSASVFGGIVFNSSFLIGIPIILAIFLFCLAYNTIYYKRSKLSFFKEYIHYSNGVFFKRYYYALLDNIKDITTVTYPFSKSGSVRFNVASEQTFFGGGVEQPSQSRQNNPSSFSNNFQINYIQDIENKDELIDIIFYKRPQSSFDVEKIEESIKKTAQETILIAKQNVSNSLVSVICLSVLFFPFLIFLPILIPLTIWSIKVKSYIIQPYRIIAKSGILYKKQTSILNRKIDHINFSQGLLNKIFSNGNITINTTGSSHAEIVISDIPNYKEFYEEIKKHY